MKHRPRSRVLALLGVAFLFVGIVAAFFGPVEMYCYYLFAPGGAFAYEGFGFGSFMFANLTCQIAGYYAIALVLIPLGYGHLRLWRWTRTVTLVLLWSGVVLAVPLLIVFLLILFSSKSLSLPMAAAVLVVVAVGYPSLTALLIRFYRSEDTRRTFEAADARTYEVERRPMAVLVLGTLFGFYTLVLHVPILMNGLFPLFGTWLTGLEGIVALTLAILCSALLTWGISGQRGWAWWGAVAFWGAMAASVVVTLLDSTWQGLLALARFPAFEVDMLQGVPIQGIHLAVFFGLPLALTMGLLLWARRYFRVLTPESP
jgi:hypothetical protein